MSNTPTPKNFQKMDLLRKFFLLIPIILIALLALSILSPIIKDNFQDMTQKKYPKKHFIGVVQVNSVITQPFVDRIIGNIDRVSNDKKLIGFLFVFNSPGGDPSASQNLMSFIKNLKTKYPTFGYINTTCTSGCYYSAIGIEKLNINKNATVGSVGVLMKLIDASELALKIGLNEKTITVGEYKKPFSTINGLTEANEKYIKTQMLIPVYNNFVNDVIAERKIEGNREKIISNYFDGKVFIGNDKNIQGILVDNVIDYYTYKNNLLELLGKTPLEVNFTEIKENNTLDFLDKIKKIFDISSKQNYTIL